MLSHLHNTFGLWFVYLDHVSRYNLEFFLKKLFIHVTDFKLFLLLGMHIGSVDCLVDSGTTHNILKHKDYFINITPKVTSLTTISGPLTLVAGFGKA